MNLKNCIVGAISTTKDRGVKITLYTQELSPSQLAELMVSANNEILSVDIPDDMSETKSKGQRLRDVFFRLWEQENTDKFDTFTLFYNHIMEKIINHYKDKLK